MVKASVCNFDFQISFWSSPPSTLQYIFVFLSWNFFNNPILRQFWKWKLEAMLVAPHWFFSNTLNKYFSRDNVFFFSLTTNINKTPQSDCINTINTYFEISFEAVFFKMLWANGEMLFFRKLTSSFYIGQPLFPDTRAFVFTRQPMKRNFIWSTRAITSSMCIAARHFYLS